MEKILSVFLSLLTAFGVLAKSAPHIGSPAIVATQSGSLNVRSGAGISYPVLDQLANNTRVTVLSCENGWYLIRYGNAKNGYVKSEYIILKNGDTNSYKKISLQVPNFKQTDERWKNVRIATSGKTIGQIGCATTGIAMIESYRGGTTIFPDAMSKKLAYSASGSVYWPSDYIAVTNSTNYLQGVYNMLASGKPVLIGAKTSSGGQHWVVITGYTGGNTLTASGFTVNDPGSSYRTNLAQFLNVYPIFYKYFRY